MIRHCAIATIALTASIAAPAAAGMLTMTVDSTDGWDAWSGYTRCKMVLTIESSDLDTAGSAAGRFTLQAWDFKAFDSNDVQVFAATGSASAFSMQGAGPVYKAQIELQSGNITTNLSPAANYLAFSYEFTASATLAKAITDSATLNRGALSLGTNLGGGGDLSGLYAVPAPSALALLGVGGLMGRRRRN